MPQIPTWGLSWRHTSNLPSSWLPNPEYFKARVASDTEHDSFWRCELDFKARLHPRVINEPVLTCATPGGRGGDNSLCRCRVGELCRHVKTRVVLIAQTLHALVWHRADYNLQMKSRRIYSKRALGLTASWAVFASLSALWTFSLLYFPLKLKFGRSDVAVELMLMPPLLLSALLANTSI